MCVCGGGRGCREVRSCQEVLTCHQVWGRKIKSRSRSQVTQAGRQAGRQGGMRWRWTIRVCDLRSHECLRNPRYINLFTSIQDVFPCEYVYVRCATLLLTSYASSFYGRSLSISYTTTIARKGMGSRAHAGAEWLGKKQWTMGKELIVRGRQKAEWLEQETWWWQVGSRMRLSG